jgi:hypothetical protein
LRILHRGFQMPQLLSEKRYCVPLVLYSRLHPIVEIISS